MLNCLAKELVVELFWTPGHNGIDGNEMAEELSRLLMWHPVMGPKPTMEVSYTQIQK